METPYSGRFLPKAIVDRLEAGASGQSASIELEGVALLLRPPVEDLAAGERDEPIDQLNAAYAVRLNCIQSWGGEVIEAVAGDLLAWWPAGEDLADTLRYAAACALDLVGDTRLGAGLSCGRLRATRIRSVQPESSPGERTDHFLLTVGGSAVVSAKQAVERASPGTCSVDISTGGLLGVGLENDWDAGFGPLHGWALYRPDSQPGQDLSPLDEDVARRYLPRTVGRTGAEFGGWRSVCVVQLHVGGFGRRGQEALKRQEAALQILRRALEASEATVGMRDEDAHLVFDVIFSRAAPSEPDIGQATQFALAMTRDLRALGLVAHAGIAGGRVFDGLLGAPGNRIRASIGAPLHRAAALAQIRGGVLVNAVDTDTISANFDTRFFPGDGTARRVLGPRLSTRYGPALIEKAESWARITQAIEGLVAGNESGLLNLVSAPGMGKSSLLVAAAGRARASGVTVLCATGRAAHGHSALYPWRQLITETVGHSADLAAAIEASLGAQFTDRLALLNDVLPIALPESSKTQHLEGGARAEATRGLVAQCLRALVDGPLLVVLNKVHHFDSSSTKLIATLAATPDTLVLTASCPGLGKPWIPTSMDERRVIPDPLSTEGCSLVAEVALGQQISLKLARYIDARANGNGLFTAQLALLLRETGALIGSPELTISGQAEGDHLAPASVQGVISRRIKALSDPAQMALRVASVMAAPFDAAQLHAIHPAPTTLETVNAALQMLLSRGLVRAARHTSELYEIAHPVTAAVAYSGQVDRDRAVLHGRVARWLQSDPRTTQAHGLLAFHWGRAGNPRQAVRYAELAGLHALRTGAFTEAVTHLKRCLETENRNGLAPPPQGPVDLTRLRHVRWHRLLSDAFEGLGASQHRADHAQMALRVAGESEATSRSGLLADAAFEVLSMPLRSRTTPADAASLTLEGQVEFEVTRAWRQRSAAHRLENQSLRALHAAASAHRHMRTLGIGWELARATADVASCCASLGLHRYATRAFSHAASLSAESADPASAIYVAVAHASFLVGQGRWGPLGLGLDAAQGHADAVGDTLGWREAQLLRAWHHYYRGEHAQATSAAGERELACSQANGQHISWAVVEALATLERGEPEHAAVRLERSLLAIKGDRGLTENLPIWSALAVTRLRLGAEAEALEALEVSLNLIESGARPSAHIMISGYAGAAEVAICGRWNGWSFDHLGGPEVVTRKALKGLDTLAKTLPIGAPYRALWRGVAQCLWGKPSGGKRTLRRGLVAARRLEMLSLEQRILTALSDPVDAL